MNEADWCKVRANQCLSMLQQPCMPPIATMWRISELHRKTQYVKQQSLNDGSSWLPLLKWHGAFVCKCRLVVALLLA